MLVAENEQDNRTPKLYKITETNLDVHWLKDHYISQLRLRDEVQMKQNHLFQKYPKR